jgi:hypothetical protein
VLTVSGERKSEPEERKPRKVAITVGGGAQKTIEGSESKS